MAICKSNFLLIVPELFLPISIFFQFIAFTSDTSGYVLVSTADTVIVIKQVWAYVQSNNKAGFEALLGDNWLSIQKITLPADFLILSGYSMIIRNPVWHFFEAMFVSDRKKKDIPRNSQEQ